MSSKRKLIDFLEQDLHAVQNLLTSQNIDESLTTESGVSMKADGEHIKQEKDADFTQPPIENCQPERSEEDTDLTSTGTVPPVSQVELRKIIDEFVDVYERLDSSDDVSRKPNYSYTELIFLALMRSHNFCLPIHEIYLYIETRFTFFRKYTRGHWKNAVRHSLSKTRCFTKIGIKKQSNRLCYLWTVVPVSVLNFARGDYRPKVDEESGTNTLRWGFYQVNASDFWNQCAVAVADRLALLRHALDTCPDPARIFSIQVCSLPELGEREGVHFSSVDQTRSYVTVKRELEDIEASPTAMRHEEPSKNDQPYSPFHTSRGTDAVSTSFSKDPNTSLNTSASGSDSEASYTASSHDSGRETLSDLSSPEELYQRLSYHQHGCLIMMPAFGTPPYSNDLAYNYHLPEVQFDSIRDIPVVPELPPLELTPDDSSCQSCLPCATESGAADNVGHYTDCMFQSKPDSKKSSPVPTSKSVLTSL